MFVFDHTTKIIVVKMHRVVPPYVFAGRDCTRGRYHQVGHHLWYGGQSAPGPHSATLTNEVFMPLALHGPVLLQRYAMSVDMRAHRQ